MIVKNIHLSSFNDYFYTLILLGIQFIFFYFYILYVFYKRVDEDSGLHKDLQELTNHPKLEDHLGLQFLFKVSCY